MSNHETPRSANGQRDPSFRTALIINANLARQIETRAAIRETGLFRLTLSCESSAMAREVLESRDTPELYLILLEASLAPLLLPHIPPKYLPWTVLTHEPEVNFDGNELAVPHPISAAVILDVMSRFGRQT